MPNYLRPEVTGAAVLFTVTLPARGSSLLVDEMERLREAVRVTRAERPFGIVACVVLPNHLHCIWRLPAGDRDFPVRWGAIKSRFTRSLRDGCREGFNPTASFENGKPVGWNLTLRRSASRVR